jgi:hypothetical protein
MRQHRFLIVAVVVLTVIGLAGGSVWAASNKATIHVQKKAKSNGEIKFSLTPAGGEAQEIAVTVMSKMSPGEVAKDIMKELSVALGDAFIVKQSGSQKVLVKTADKKATFDIVISGQTASGLSVSIN